MTTLPHWTVQDYLDFERRAESRSEFIAGDVLAMAGASERHNQIASALHFTLYGQLLERPCQVFQSDMRVQAAGKTAFFYPDLVVVCDEARYRDGSQDTLLNPTVIIEVLSPCDRGRKFTFYRRIPSLKDYVLVAQKQAQVEHYARQVIDAWLPKEYTGVEEVVTLASIGCALRLGDIYRT